MFIGIASGLGESTILGFCKGFPSRFVGIFCSGIGCSGIFSSLTYLLLKSGGFGDSTIFYLFMISPILLILAFMYLHRTKQRYPNIRIGNETFST